MTLKALVAGVIAIGLGTALTAAPNAHARDGFFVSLEAESMQTKTGGTEFPDGWNLSGEGSVAENIDFPTSGMYRFEIIAAGNGLVPNENDIELLIDQKSVAGVEVTSSDWRSYTALVQVEAGAHQVAMALVPESGESGGGRSREIYLDRLVVASPRARPRGEQGTDDDALVLEAENMPIKTAGIAIADGWNLYANGYVAQRVRFPAAGSYKFQVIAGGRIANGVGPQMELRIDQEVVRTVNVTNPEWQAYEAEIEVPEGNHEVALAFVNDFDDPAAGQDRNLHLDKLTIGGVREGDDDDFGDAIVLEAESMTTQIGGEPIPNGWKIFREGLVADKARLANDASYNIKIIAGGRPAAGVWPEMELSVDGRSAAVISIVRGGWKGYEVKVELSAGEHEFEVAFTNDYFDPETGQDRNLYLDKIIIDGGPVDPGNEPPTISGDPATSVTVGDAYAFEPTANDPDGDVLAFLIDNKPSWANFDSATGALSGTPGEDDAGVTTGIVIAVSDGLAKAALAPFDITVEPLINDNTPPTISGTPATSVTVGEDYGFTPRAEDADGDLLTFGITNKPDWASFDPATGALKGTPGAADEGTTVDVTINVSDGDAAAALEPFDLTVNPLVDPNTPPTISGTPATSVAAGAAYEFKPEAADEDNDTLTFAIENKPEWAAFDSATGALTGTPEATDEGTTSAIVISVSDGQASAALDPFDLAVTSDPNTPPTISGTPTTTVVVGSSYQFTPEAADEDGDTLNFSIANKPTWASFDDTTGGLSGTPADGDVGTTEGIVISVSDGTDSASLEAFDLKVDAPANFDRKEAARLLTQTTFGPTMDEIERVANGGAEAFVDQQLAASASLQVPYLQSLQGQQTNINRVDRIDAWWRNVLYQDDQLRQRVSLALSEIMVISDRDVLGNRHIGVANFSDILTRNAFGNFCNLVEEVTLNPAMGVYLSMLGNERPDEDRNIRPDENYARELMQLFTIGLNELNMDGTEKSDGQGEPIPTYTQEDIEGLAHVFTGWNYAGTPRWTNPRRNFLEPMEPWEEFHAEGEKRIVNGGVIPAGGTAREDLETALNIICTHPNVAPFISSRLIKLLVTSNPKPSYVSRVAEVFENSGGNLGAVVKAILLDDEARNGHRSDPQVFGKLKEPLLRQSALWRAFDARSGSGKFFDYNIAQQLAQAPQMAPSVFNFFQFDYKEPTISDGLVSPEFQIHTDVTITEVSNRLFVNTFYRHTGISSPNERQVLIDIDREKALAADAAALADHLDLLLCSGHMSAPMRTELIALVESRRENETERRALEAIHLTVTSPDCAVQR